MLTNSYLAFMLLTAFRDFLLEQERWRQKYMASSKDAERLQMELDKALQAMSDLETKLFHARRLLEVETKSRREAEHDRDSNVRIPNVLQPFGRMVVYLFIQNIIYNGIINFAGKKDANLA